MSWVITGSEKTPVDKLGIQNVSLLLHGNADGSGNILDSSPSPKTVSKFGNTASATPPSYPNSNSSFGNAIAFDGTGDNLRIGPSSDFTFGTGDFTCECWTYISAYDDKGLFQQTTSSFSFSGPTNSVAVGTNATKTWQIYAKNTNTNSTVEYVTNTWHHVALIRHNAVTKLYVNGTAVITVNSDDTNYTGTYFGVGSIFNTTISFNGYIDEMRVTKGIARYTSNFTPPTAPFPDI